MRDFISQTTPKLMFFLAIQWLMTACNTSTASHLAELEQKSMLLPSGEKLSVFIAKDYQEQKKGLSGIKPTDFKDHEAMFFPSDRMQVRQFWMPNTHFDLDIIFLNKDLYVLDIHRSLQHFPNEQPKNLIPKSKEVFCQHVLEVKSSSPLAKKIEPGMILKWEN